MPPTRVRGLMSALLCDVAGRRWHRRRPELVELAYTLGNLGFDVRDPPLVDIAEWTGRGLTAYDASYVALAKVEGVKLFTDDERLIAIAEGVVLPISAVGA